MKDNNNIDIHPLFWKIFIVLTIGFTIFVLMVSIFIPV